MSPYTKSNRFAAVPGPLGSYAKAILYIALAAVMFLVTALQDNLLSLEELVNLAVAIVAAIGVYLVPNLPGTVLAYGKAFVAFVAAALIALLSFLSDGVTVSEWLQIGVAALAGVGVTIVPNTPLPESTQRAIGF